MRNIFIQFSFLVSVLHGALGLGVLDHEGSLPLVIVTVAQFLMPSLILFLHYLGQVRVVEIAAALRRRRCLIYKNDRLPCYLLFPMFIDFNNSDY